MQKEAAFYLEELFFSRTNFKGQIQSGNSVFQRVSGFSWDELIGRPHNVVRHPDMPRGVFRLFWKELEEGHPIGAYVKNRSKDDCYYWVYALAFPIESGYLSIRLKPSSVILQTIAKEYASLCDVEESIPLNESVSLLIKRIQELGFISYQEFMCTSLIEELNHRKTLLTGVGDEVMENLKRLSSVNKEMNKLPEHILSLYKVIALTPLNLQISALKLGDIGRSVGVVASTYQKMISDIEKEIHEFERSAVLVEREIMESTFLIASCALINELIQFFKQEDLQDELHCLEALQRSYNQKTEEILVRVKETLCQYIQLCKKLNSLIIGLEVVRLTGRMEVGRLDQCHGFNILLDDLKVFQSEVSESLKILESKSSQIVSTLEKLKK